ncbi:MAG: hypothetical protein CMI96_00305 [Pelagibacteraceae bacterium]|nr:hypothetical protein [Pelagibacteraceae bacterium]|tara:strand:- start:37543 stop:38217 length:675 start_codon:yes stop_codon:yes gene_type:complete
MFIFIKKIFFFFYREYKYSIINLNELFINITFFFLSIFIFIFAIGPDKEVLETIGIGIIWSLLLLSSTLSLKKYYYDDFNNNNLILMHMSGFSFEVIAILKILCHFLFVQIPFLISIPIASLFVNISLEKIYMLITSFLIGSLILSCLGSISSSMNLLNNKSYSLGSIIVMVFSIPVIIFSVGIINAQENFLYLINILLGILFIFIAISPWVSSICIKLALQNN